MAQAKDPSKPAVKTPGPEGLPHPRRDAQDSDAGARPTVPKTAGAREPATSPLDSRIANRNTGRRRETGPTPRPTDKPFD
ncbi:hypothetical protein LB553_02470 [Mesorhizobium sp. CA8]|uniref:hypothetical protein n=1 Tax=Mesorhizobium sp. CA8 TaxID=2876637 RepID=UPI001CCB6AF5|nr:hypothetical protein [Mesorhizobium sp. CA8]MBZ9759749.1 hypothetical protein [Mesorhizobium sp. CA8]